MFYVHSVSKVINIPKHCLLPPRLISLKRDIVFNIFIQTIIFILSIFSIILTIYFFIYLDILQWRDSVISPEVNNNRTPCIFSKLQPKNSDSVFTSYLLPSSKFISNDCAQKSSNPSFTKYLTGQASSFMSPETRPW